MYDLTKFLKKIDNKSSRLFTSTWRYQVNSQVSKLRIWILGFFLSFITWLYGIKQIVSPSIFHWKIKSFIPLRMLENLGNP